MSKVIRKIREVLSYAPASGVASPNGRVFFDTSCIPLADVMKLYDRDPTCKSSIDLLAASTVGMGFYTTADEKYDKASQAKAAVDKFCEDVNLDGLLNDMAKPLIGCGNDFWLKLATERLADTLRMPIDAVQRIGLSSVPDLKDSLQSHRLSTSRALMEEMLEMSLNLKRLSIGALTAMFLPVLVLDYCRCSCIH